MDIVTQALLGGVLAQSVATKEEKKIASLVGVVAGLIADADFLISSANDPLLNIEYHRHFTHSLFFIPFGAFIAFMLFWPFLRHRLLKQKLYLFCLVGYSMSGIIDACTSYGTHLFWPFSDERVAWHIISIIDPVFTLILFISFVLSLRIKKRQVAFIGLGLAVSYMSLGIVQLQRAKGVAEELVVSRGHTTAKHVVKPTLANLVLWRSTYIYNNRIYVDAVRVGFINKKVFEGESVEQVTLQKNFSGLDMSTALYNDIQRFTKFSDGYVAYDTTQPDVLGDIRYSMLPTSAKPLWGILINKQQPQVHADYRFFRENSKDVRQSFMDMLIN